MSKRNDNKIMDYLIGLFVFAFIAFGAAYFIYEHYLDTKQHIACYIVNYTPKRYGENDELAVTDKVSVTGFPYFDNDSSSIRKLRENAVNKRNEEIRHFQERRSKLAPRLKNHKDFTAPIEFEAYSEMLDSLNETQKYVVRITYTRDFKLDTFKYYLGHPEQVSKLYDYDFYNFFIDLSSLTFMQGTYLEYYRLL